MLNKDFKKEYENIKIPKELSSTVDEAIFEGMSSKRKKSFVVTKSIASSAAVFFVVFVALLNTNKAFAMSFKDIPVIGSISKVFTFREYESQDDLTKIKVKVPHIQNVNNSDLEKRINLEISKMIDKEIKDAKIRADEYWDAFIATGGKKEDYIPIEITVDYKIMFSDKKYVSFVIYKSETLASAYQGQYYYNIDLKTGKIVTIKDLIGPNYKTIVTKAVNDEISKWSTDKKELMFDFVNIENLITTDRSFYINKNKEIVIVFSKYEIACGAMGTVEIPIGQIIE